jgi:hypothetical protein
LIIKIGEIKIQKVMSMSVNKANLIFCIKIYLDIFYLYLKL